MTIATNLAGVGEAGEFPCGENAQVTIFLLESGAFRMSQRARTETGLQQGSRRSGRAAEYFHSTFPSVTLPRRSAKLVSPTSARPGHQSDRDYIFANLTLGSKTERGAVWEMLIIGFLSWRASTIISNSTVAIRLYLEPWFSARRRSQQCRNDCCRSHPSRRLESHR